MKFTKEQLIRKARIYNKNIPVSFFDDKDEKDILSWLHPNDRKEISLKSIMKSKYENLFYSPKGGRPVNLN